jgi:catechol 2,3-dioxygenase-like lactoylglutathione lyase family enzyme
MYDHIGVKDFDASVRFYEAVLATLGYVLCSRDDSGASFGPEGEPALWLHRNFSVGPGIDLACRATDRAAVDGFHREGVRAGGRDNGRPGLRIEYSSNYYAAFLLDLDGNNIEAVHMG